MKNIIKSDIYYFFNNKINFLCITVISVLLTLKSWVYNDYVSYKSMPSSILIMSFDSISMVIANAVLLGLLMNNMFKNGMINNQYNLYRNKTKPFFSLNIAGMFVSLILMTPFCALFIVLTIINGKENESVALFRNASAQPLINLAFIVLGMIICLIGFTVEMVSLSYIVKSEKKGIIIATSLEVILVALSVANVYGEYFEIPKIAEGILLSLSTLNNLILLGQTSIRFGDIGFSTGMSNLYWLVMSIIGTVVKVMCIFIIVKLREKRE